MHGKRLMLVFGLSCALSVRADYVADRRAAEVLVRQGKHEAALTAFTQMAETAASDRQKGDALEQAALCAQRLKRVEEAMALAERIPQTPIATAVRMGLMLQNGQREALIEEFGNEDFSTWPERAAGRAFYCRGLAYQNLRNGKAAATDLHAAMANLGYGPVRDEARLNLAHNYRNNLRDHARALEVYLEGVEKSRDAYGWIHLTCVVSAADILRTQGKPDAALHVLDTITNKAMTGYWGAAMLCAYGDVFAAQGNKEEALATFKAALAVKDLPDASKAACTRRIRALNDNSR